MKWEHGLHFRLDRINLLNRSAYTRDLKKWRGLARESTQQRKHRHTGPKKNHA